MSFPNLAPQPPLNPEADKYGEECLRRSAAVRPGQRGRFDVAFGADPLQSLDVFLPKEDVSGAPVLLFMHGGGWTHGYKEWCGFMAPALNARGIILVSGSYRLAPTAVFPAAVKDSIAALAWVQANIGALGGSPERLFVGGHSAGGQIAAVMALHPDWLEEAGLAPGTIKAAFCLSTTFHRHGITGTPGAGYVLPPGPLQVDPESALALLANAGVPFHFGWGGRERQRERVERSSLQMLGALRDRNIKTGWTFFPDADHFSIHLDCEDPANPWMREIGDWMLESAA